MNVTIFIAHELKIRQRNSDRFCADPKEPADINDCRTARTCPMDMVDLPDLVVVSAIDGCTFENCRCQFRGVQANVIGVVHVVSSVRLFAGKEPRIRWFVPELSRWSITKNPVESNQVVPQFVQSTVPRHGFPQSEHGVVSFTKKIKDNGGG
ncbi:hypothetical protein GGE35_004716 [Rhizobium cellulosilyticum]|uniref:Uncharacterized protein n=1 Tax=Aliirhizobium cellulosilyticum TaxID=393664 RepID=A0A7W6XCX6_9HYPH|nr:hypothetical protein [Rhizobium cellulosilyticum]MBB4414250.1 hypothetical protein [Rhizobium cellulosilyticum]MBB4448866.1 hypothetical protein [Rhizobium cellulosilyticum]